MEQAQWGNMPLLPFGAVAMLNILSMRCTGVNIDMLGGWSSEDRRSNWCWWAGCMLQPQLCPDYSSAAVLNDAEELGWCHSLGLFQLSEKLLCWVMQKSPANVWPWLVQLLEATAALGDAHSCFVKAAWGDAQRLIPGRCNEVCLLCSVLPHGNVLKPEHCCQCPAWTSQLWKAEVSLIQGWEGLSDLSHLTWHLPFAAELLSLLPLLGSGQAAGCVQQAQLCWCHQLHCSWSMWDLQAHLCCHCQSADEAWLVSAPGAAGGQLGLVPACYAAVLSEAAYQRALYKDAAWRVSSWHSHIWQERYQTVQRRQQLLWGLLLEGGSEACLLLPASEMQMQQ